MVKVTINGEEYSVKGTFDFGYIGLFKDDDIELYDFKDIISKRKGRWWDKAVEAALLSGRQVTNCLFPSACRNSRRFRKRTILKRRFRQLWLIISTSPITAPWKRSTQKQRCADCFRYLTGTNFSTI